MHIHTRVRAVVIVSIKVWPGIYQGKWAKSFFGCFCFVSVNRNRIVLYFDVTDINAAQSAQGVINDYVFFERFFQKTMVVLWIFFLLLLVSTFHSK